MRIDIQKFYRPGIWAWNKPAGAVLCFVRMVGAGKNTGGSCRLAAVPPEFMGDSFVIGKGVVDNTTNPNTYMMRGSQQCMVAGGGRMADNQDYGPPQTTAGGALDGDWAYGPGIGPFIAGVANGYGGLGGGSYEAEWGGGSTYTQGFDSIFGAGGGAMPDTTGAVGYYGGSVGFGYLPAGSVDDGANGAFSLCGEGAGAPAGLLVRNGGFPGGGGSGYATSKPGDGAAWVITFCNDMDVPVK